MTGAHCEYEHLTPILAKDKAHYMKCCIDTDPIAVIHINP